jgi:hypothetical protein
VCHPRGPIPNLEILHHLIPDFNNDSSSLFNGGISNYSIQIPSRNRSGNKKEDTPQRATTYIAPKKGIRRPILQRLIDSLAVCGIQSYSYGADEDILRS